MKGTVKIALEDYERLKNVAQTYESKTEAIDSERAELKRKLDFSRVTLTVFAQFMLQHFKLTEVTLDDMVKEFNKTGTAVKLEVRSHEGRPYLIAKEKPNEYIK